MVGNDRKHKKMMKKVSCPSCRREAHLRRMKENEQKSLLSAIESDSQKLVDTHKLVAHLEFCCFLLFFLHEQHMCVTQNVL